MKMATDCQWEEGRGEGGEEGGREGGRVKEGGLEPPPFVKS